MIKIIVDSTCDLPQDILKEYDIKVMPLNVLINDVEYRDRVDIQTDQVYEYMKKGVVPRTSQIYPEEIYNTFIDYAKKTYDFIYLAFSSALSGTFDLAKMIQKEIKDRYPKVHMEVVDSKSGSFATGIIALQAAKLADKGYEISEILEQVNFMVKHIEHIFVISDLSWLLKGGRISKIAAKTGSILNLRPLLDVQNGHLKVIGVVRGKKKALRAIVDLVAQRIKNFPNQIVGISHADDLQTAQEVVELLKEKIGISNTMIEKIGCVLGAHLGIGGVGVFFLNLKPKLYID
ncbi:MULTISPECIES: DegV family protein [Tissierellales]|jgi:DegV family protein with EDD domain|uniref:DegV family protein n=1 Tax=Acidilutibacter cellobiosedens TaxID=2507161 RepID=A0A410QAS4_9FIRM|nr:MULTISPECIES: DegV family protein [Tissierellales]MBE6082264.1 DegV family protein [Tissierellaceae bacterium]QAT61057.1 DegV family protein [Acidilutibacter cellobiosedens]SCL89542.1 Fatty acid-binding protein [Sporanaerobacter sp. PP17-6a]